MKKIFMLLALTASTAFAGDESCTAEKKRGLCEDTLIQSKVEEACKLLETKGEAALADVKKIRFDCCNEPNYVWINDMKPTMVMHPIKPMLDGKDLTENKDPKGKALFVEFVKAVKDLPPGSKEARGVASENGAWVEYMWTKMGESDPTPKKSWVKKCQPKDTKKDWVVGSGKWY